MDDVKATLDGVLEVSVPLPAKPDTTTRKVEIQESAKAVKPAGLGGALATRNKSEADEQVIDLNRAAMRHMTAPVQLEIVPGATHLFEEPGTLEEVCRLAAAWCVRHLRKDGAI